MVAPALLAALLQGWLPAVRFMPASIVEAVARVSPARLQLDCAPENLPADTLIMQEENPNVWLDETLEYSGLRDDPHTPHALRGYLCSFKLPSGIGCHAFKGGGVPLGKYIGQGGSSWDSDDRFTDTERLRLVMDLLDAVNHLHCRGCPHLDLTVDSIIVRKTADGRDRLSLIGVGAAVRLQPLPDRKVYQLATPAAFRAPETISGVIIETNLRSLLRMDAWSVGVLVAMIASQASVSPFAASPAWTRAEFSDEAATSRTISETLALLGPWLQQLDADGGGFLFRHGWLVKILLGLLTPDRSKRMTVHDAYTIARKAIASAVENQTPRIALGGPPSTNAAPSPTLGAGARDTSDGGASGDESRPQAEMQRFRKGGDASRRAEWGGGAKSGEKEREPFRSLEAIVNIVERSRASIVIEDGRWQGVRNYGEIIGFRNRADGDRWDVFVPGVRAQLPVGEHLPLRRIYGVVLIKGGNHKLAVGLDPPYAPESRALVNADVQEFVRVYTREHPSTSSSRVRYLELDSVEEWVPEAAPVAVVGTPGGGGEGPRGDVQARGKEKGSSAAGLGGGKGGRGGGSEESEQARRRARSRDS